MKRILSLLYFFFFNLRKRYVDFMQTDSLVAYNHRFEGKFPGQNNFMYGNLQAVHVLEKKSIFNVNFYIEHGVVFNDSIGSVRYLPKRIKQVYTYSERRAAILQSHYPQKKVIALGPYILNIPFFKRKSELDKLKKTNGKTLVVFPVHSLPTNEAIFDEDSFFKEIDKVAKTFNKVYICLHYLDILKSKDILYRNKGFDIVCAGHKYDIHFINRLKDIIYLSDVTMSNSLGTHLGYSICLHRPHYFYHQNVEIKEGADERQNQYEIKEAMAKEQIKNEASRLFTVNHEITALHYSFVFKYWGFF